ncbi:hypothetical protein PV326_014274, partial [Microctonus aethiopoides]
PDHLTKDFLFPNSLLDESQIRNLSPKCTVRIAGSFDMGWPTKGSGRSYDSLSGTAGIIGAINAARNSVDYEIIKHDDINHTSKGVVSQLYKNIRCSKVLNASAIKYLDSSFKYCVMKNKGNELEMARAIENIPQHCFNNHKNCGEWCRYLKDPNSYQHSTIGEGLTDPRLYEILTNIFSTLAKKANGFSAGVSSNPNESFNCTVASKAPKSKMYGTSASYSFRVDFAVNKKNDGEKFIVELAKKSHCSPGKNTKKYCDLADSSSSRRYEKSITPKFKRRRLFLRQKKSELRHKNESSEGTTYQSNVTFLDSLFDGLQMAYTLPHIRVATRSKQCGDNKLQNLAKRLEIRGFQAHDALGDVSILERVLVKLNISQQQLIKSSLNWNDAKEKVLFADKCNLLLKSYKILNKGTSVAIRKKMIISNISFNDIKDTYKESGQDGIARLLDVDENGRIRVTKTKSVITKLCDFLKTKYNI